MIIVWRDVQTRRMTHIDITFDENIQNRDYVGATPKCFCVVKYFKMHAILKAVCGSQVENLLGLCLGWYGHRRSSILQQPARGREATTAKPVAASRLWCAVPAKQRNIFLTF